MPNPDAQTLADTATRHHRDGDLDSAERLYRQALQADPQLPDGLHGMGLLALGRGLPAQAIALIGRAVALSPDTALYTLNLGLALLAQGHVEPARAALNVAVLRDPGDARAHAGLATALERLGRFDDAATAARNALARSAVPGMTALLGRAAACRQAWDDAIVCFTQAVSQAPGDARSWHDLAVAHAALGQSDDAERCFRQVLALRPDDPAALANLGVRLFEQNRLDQALPLLRQAVALGNPTAETLSNLGLVLLALGHLHDAERILSDAVRLGPDHSGIAVNHGTALAELGRVAEAERIFADIEARVPGTLDATRARFDRATLLLATGRFAPGWKAFEARRTLLGGTASPLPDWDGRRLVTGGLLLEAEQGLGDTIHFLRYVAPAMQSAPVTLVLPRSLVRLARRSLPAGCTVLARGESPTGCIARAGLLSLPLLLGLDRPFWAGRYLSAPPGDTPIGVRGAVGLCWAGSPEYRFDRRRSVALRKLMPLRDTTGNFVSLQSGPPSDQPDPPGMRLLRPALSDDFSDTASLIAGLDLVITVDTAIAHLAGALGRPVWLLNRFGGDWRWNEGNLSETGDSLWYPSLRPFQQTTAEGGWDEVVQLIAERLKAAP